MTYTVLQFMQTDLYLFLKRFLLINPVDDDVPVYRTKNINTSSGLAFLKTLKPDVILLANFNQKVSCEVIAIPALSCLNIHPSILPKYKGVDPVFAALFENERTLGVTVHLVDENFDTGTILGQSVLSVENNASVFKHQVELFRIGGKLAVDMIKRLVSGDLKYSKNAEGNYDSWPAKTKIKLFNKRGGRLLRLTEYWAVLKEELTNR